MRHYPLRYDSLTSDLTPSVQVKGCAIIPKGRKGLKEKAVTAGIKYPSCTYSANPLLFISSKLYFEYNGFRRDF